MKKDENIEEHSRISETDSWIQQEMKALIRHVSKIMDSEITKYEAMAQI